MMQTNVQKILIYSLFFLIVTALMVTGISTKLDQELQFELYNFFNNELITKIALFITDYTLGTTLAIGAVTLMLAYKQHLYAIASLGITFIALYLSQFILKHLTARPRPFMANTDIAYLGSLAPNYFSYPSGHTLIAVFLATVIAFKFKHSRIIVTITYTLATLVALSRVYLGAHFPIDVLGGVFLGLAFGHIAVVIDSKLIANNDQIRKFTKLP